MKSCKTCAHWKNIVQDNDKQYGYCYGITMSETISKNGDIVIIDSVKPTFITNECFGCMKYEQNLRETNKNEKCSRICTSAIV